MSEQSRLNRREKIMVMVMLLVVTLFIYYMLFYKPLTAELLSLQRQKDQQEDELKSNGEIISKIPVLRDECRQLACTAGAQQQKHYLSREDILKIGSEQAAETGARLAYYGSAAGSPGLLQMVIEGSFVSISDFLAGLAGQDQGIKLYSLHLEPEPGVPRQQGVLRLKLIVNQQGVMVSRTIRKG